MSESITLLDFASALRETVSRRPRFMVVAHARPDGDTVGSCAGLCRVLRFLGCEAEWVCADAIPLRLQLLDDREDHTIGAMFPEFVAEDGSIALPDDLVVMSLDTAEYSLMGDDYAALLEGRVDFKFDHHHLGTPFGKFCHIDGNIGSCGELCTVLSTRLLGEDVAIPTEAATLFFAAISSDTGGFKYTNATANTHRVAAYLMDLGGDSDYVATKLYGQRSRTDIAALGMAFSNMTYHMDGRVALLTVTNEMKEAAGLCDDDLGELASLPRDIAGVEVGITLKQVTDEPTKFKVSMRSNGADVSAMCRKVGGGGHIRASGALIEAESKERAEEIILATVEFDDGCEQ